MPVPTPPVISFPDTQTPFRFFCQKVLPAVYDDSLSYYELLCKVIDYLNTTMSNVNALNGDVQQINDFVTTLRNYMDNYFTNLDVQEEINNKLDQMAQDGTLEEYINVKLIGKKYVFYGDSTVALFGSTSVPNMFAKWSGATVENRGVSGTRITPTSTTTNDQSLYWLMNLATEADFTGIDGIFLCYGTNEWQTSVNPYMANINISTERTTEASLFYCINRLQTLTDAPIFIVAPVFGHRNFGGLPNVNNIGMRLENYADAFRRIGHRFGIPVIDLGQMFGINETNYEDYFVDDSGGSIFVHYNEELRDMVGFALSYAYPYSNETRPNVTSTDILLETTAPAANLAAANTANSLLSAYNFPDCTAPVYAIQAGQELVWNAEMQFNVAEPLNISGYAHCDAGFEMEVGVTEITQVFANIDQNGYFNVQLPVGYYSDMAHLRMKNNGSTVVYVMGVRAYYGAPSRMAIPGTPIYRRNFSLAPWLSANFEVGSSNPAFLNIRGNEVYFGGDIVAETTNSAIGLLPRALHVTSLMLFPVIVQRSSGNAAAFIQISSQTDSGVTRNLMRVVNQDLTNFSIQVGDLISLNGISYILERGAFPAISTNLDY